jgi:uncharacterized repeat protein (TIGR03803 family)
MASKGSLTIKRSKRIAVVLLLVAIQSGGASGQTLSTLYQFGKVDGVTPAAGLVQGSDGYFYGTTRIGGNLNVNNGFGYGTVFQISSAGTLTTLHQFSGGDGGYLLAGLVQGNDGDFYGTTNEGGTNNAGTVFQITSAGTLTTLYQFGGVDGRYPNALIQGSDNCFYGTTSLGGTNGAGVVFKISSMGVFSNLYHFSGTDDGYPQAGLVQGSDGNFYGTTLRTVFKMSPTGSLTNLHSFSGTDGIYLYSGLAQGSNQYFYGTTWQGGTSTNCYNGCGTVFKIDSVGVFTNLYSFSGADDGANPAAGLVQGSDGNFYGTTNRGTTNNAGTVFQITSKGTLTTLFNLGSVGSTSEAELVQGSDGNFYGTTFFGGTNDNGTVFQLIVPLNPPANQISAIQLSGTNIVITIPSVAGETYQLQCRNSLSDGNWTNVAGASVTNSIGALMTLTNFGGALQPQGFYRFDITP